MEYEAQKSKHENSKPQIYYGIIASGNVVIKHGETRDCIVQVIVTSGVFCHTVSILDNPSPRTQCARPWPVLSPQSRPGHIRVTYSLCYYSTGSCIKPALLSCLLNKPGVHAEMTTRRPRRTACDTCYRRNGSLGAAFDWP